MNINNESQDEIHLRMINLIHDKVRSDITNNSSDFKSYIDLLENIFKIDEVSNNIKQRILTDIKIYQYADRIYNNEQVKDEINNKISLISVVNSGKYKYIIHNNALQKLLNKPQKRYDDYIKQFLKTKIYPLLESDNIPDELDNTLLLNFILKHLLSIVLNMKLHNLKSKKVDIDSIKIEKLEVASPLNYILQTNQNKDNITHKIDIYQSIKLNKKRLSKKIVIGTVAGLSIYKILKRLNHK